MVFSFEKVVIYLYIYWRYRPFDRPHLFLLVADLPKSLRKGASPGRDAESMMVVLLFYCKSVLNSYDNTP